MALIGPCSQHLTMGSPPTTRRRSVGSLHRSLSTVAEVFVCVLWVSIRCSRPPWVVETAQESPIIPLGWPTPDATGELGSVAVWVLFLRTRRSC
jgi:hypothetical protein